MSKKISPEEQELFKQAMHGVKRLHSDKIIISKKRIKLVKSQSIVREATYSIPLSDHEIEIVSADDTLLFARSGIQKRYLARLQKGELPIEATLDLHGFNVDHAREKLLIFIEYATNQGFRVIKIIHGKGRDQNSKPILKNKVNTWLRQLAVVLAFCSASPIAGGKGAVNVLLRKPK